jgi:hypothetical protein
MKKIIYLLVLLVILVSSVTVKYIEPNPNQDTSFIALKDRAARDIEGHLSDESKRFLLVNFDHWVGMAGILGRDIARSRFNNSSNLDRYLRQYQGEYQSAMREFLETNYMEAITEHNRRASELRQEREERNQRIRHEMKVILVNGVSGNANWRTFQQDFDPFRILTLISAQRNNSTANSVLTQTANDMDRRYREIQPLTEEQSNWYQAMSTYIFMEIGMAANFTSAHGQDAIRLARGKLEELTVIRENTP